MFINDGSGYVEQKLVNIPEGYVIDVEETNKHCTGATFSWNDETDTGSMTTTTNNKCKLYIKRKYITVNFDTNGRVVSPSTKSILHDTAFTDLPIPTKSGYSFEGWYLNGTKVTNEMFADSPSDVTLTANWIDDVTPTLSLSKITYTTDDLNNWSLTNARLTEENGEKVIIMGENVTSSRIESDFLKINGEYWYTIFDGYTNTQGNFAQYSGLSGTAGSGEGLLHPNTYWFDSNKSPVLDKGNYYGNGATYQLPLNTWSTFNCKDYKWYNVEKQIKYMKFVFIVDVNSYSPPIVKIKNFKLYGEGLENNFYLINITSSDASGITTTKYAKGNQNKIYFATNGIVVSNNQIRVTENGIYTVYVKDGAGNDTIQTIEITNIV